MAGLAEREMVFMRLEFENDPELDAEEPQIDVELAGNAVDWEGFGRLEDGSGVLGTWLELVIEIE